MDRKTLTFLRKFSIVLVNLNIANVGIDIPQKEVFYEAR